jgi:hypothetical protein
MVGSGRGDLPHDITIARANEQGAARRRFGEEVPAEVSKRGVMIGYLREPSPAGEREPISLYPNFSRRPALFTFFCIFFHRGAGCFY